MCRFYLNIRCKTVTIYFKVEKEMCMIEFGTGGWRAIIGDQFTKENVQLLAQA